MVPEDFFPFGGGWQLELCLIDRRLAQQVRHGMQAGRFPYLVAPVAAQAHQRISGSEQFHFGLAQAAAAGQLFGAAERRAGAFSHDASGGGVWQAVDQAQAQAHCGVCDWMCDCVCGLGRQEAVDLAFRFPGWVVRGAILWVCSGSSE